MVLKDSLVERFYERFVPEPNTGCWLWVGPVVGKGYGYIYDDGHTKLAHRVSYELHVGPIPNEMTLDHVMARGCVGGLCVNWGHLEPVSSGDNVLRGSGPTAMNHRKTHCIRGHEFTGSNTYWTRGGNRNCRLCRRERYLLRRNSVRMTEQEYE